MLYWIWLTTRKGIGNRTIQKILSCFETAQDVFHAGEAEYRRAGLTPKEIEALLDKSLEEPRQILRSCARKEIHILTLQDVAYPQRLRNIEDPPAVLYYTGVLPALDDEPVIAIVGSRHCSPYAMACAKRLGYQIAMSGGIVVSGMAHGADAMSTTVTEPTRALMPSAHFRPISPAPMIRTRLSAASERSSERASSSVIKKCLSFTLSRPSIGGTNGREPVAISSLSYP